MLLDLIKKNQKYIFLLSTIIIIVSLPVIQTGIFIGHDTGYHLQRIVSLEHAISNGDFFPRIYKELWDNYGYGWPLFYSQLFMYIPAILYHLGVPLILSYNIFVIIVNVLTLLLSFYSYYKLSNSIEVGFVASLLYCCSTYRLVDLYTRASVGEYLALVFLPLFLLCFVKVLKGEKKYVLWLSIAITCILQSHIITFVMIIIFSILMILFNFTTFFRKNIIIAFIKAVILTILLNLWFLVPFLDGMRLPIFQGAEDYYWTDIKVFEFFDIELNGAVSTNILNQVGITKTPGILILFGLFLLGYYLINKKINIKKLIKSKYISFCIFILGIFSLLISSALIQHRLIAKISIVNKLLTKFQFLWRFNTITVAFLSFIAAYGYIKIIRKNKLDVKLLVTILVCINTLTFMNNFTQNTIFYDVNDKLNVDRLYLTENNKIPEIGKLTTNIIDLNYYNYKHSESEVEFDYSITSDTQLHSDSYIDVPITYYPGYVAYINDHKQNTSLSPDGVVRIKINNLSGHIIVKYEEKTGYKLSDIISIITIFVVVIYIIYNSKKRKSLTKNCKPIV